MSHADNLKPWEKGKSGNPGGRPKIPDEVKEALRSAAPAAIDRLIKLTQSNDENVAVKAIEKLLDRAFGKPTQAVEHSGPDGGAIETRELTSTELARRIAFTLASAVKENEG